MSDMTPERLADIRERHSAGLGLERPGDVAALLAEVDRLREGIEGLIRSNWWTGEVHVDDLRALLSPGDEP